MKAYQRLSRTPTFRRKSSRPEDITNSSNGVNHRAALIDFAAKAMDQDIDDVGLRIETVVEDMFENHGLRHGAIGMAHEIFEQGKFARLKFDFFFAPMHFALQQVHGEVSDDEASGLGGLRGAADESLDTGEQFRKR